MKRLDAQDHVALVEHANVSQIMQEDAGCHVRGAGEEDRRSGNFDRSVVRLPLEDLEREQVFHGEVKRIFGRGTKPRWMACRAREKVPVLRVRRQHGVPLWRPTVARSMNCCRRLYRVELLFTAGQGRRGDAVQYNTMRRVQGLAAAPVPEPILVNNLRADTRENPKFQDLPLSSFADLRNVIVSRFARKMQRGRFIDKHSPDIPLPVLDDPAAHTVAADHKARLDILLSGNRGVMPLERVRFAGNPINACHLKILSDGREAVADTAMQRGQCKRVRIWVPLDWAAQKIEIP